MEPVFVDGSRGEGGGQILRTSLALSMLTGKPLRMEKIRANRGKPGLRRQHVACVDAAARLSNAEVRGARVDSSTLDFTPSRDWNPDDLDIDIGTAGSTSLVVQTILLPAILRGGAWRATIKGGTHNPMAPPIDFLARVFVPQLQAMGAGVSIACIREGFVPTGGGKVEVAVEAGAKLRPVELVDGGDVTARRATAILSGLPTHVGERELRTVRELLDLAESDCSMRELQRGGPANVFQLEVERASGAREMITVHGERGLRAEAVVQRAVDELRAYLAHGYPVGEHLADQLLLPMALAGGGRFRTGPLSLHATTNIETIQLFLDVPIRVTEISGGTEVVVA